MSDTAAQNHLEMRDFFSQIALKHLHDDDVLEQIIWQMEEFKALPTHHQFWLMGVVWGARQPKQKPPSDEVPKHIQKLQPDATWKRHPNGDGWVSSTAKVDETCTVGSQAVVFENAVVQDRAKIYGNAKVHGDAFVHGACHVHGLAMVRGEAEIRDAARVLGKVIVEGKAIVGGATMLRGVGKFSHGEYFDVRKASKEQHPHVVVRKKVAR